MMLSQPQIDRITEITNTRGAAYHWDNPVPGTTTPDPYSFVHTELQGNDNQLMIAVKRERTGTAFKDKKMSKVIPEPPSSELDQLVNDVLGQIERTLYLKPGE